MATGKTKGRKMQGLSLYRKLVFSIVVLIYILPQHALAQPAKLPFHRIPVSIASGVHDGHIGSEAKHHIAFREVIREPGAVWLRLHFESFNLKGKSSLPIGNVDSTGWMVDSTSSYITITSLEDGGQQRLDATGIRQWRSRSAYFNGDAVEIELHVAPHAKEVFFGIDEIIAGDAPDIDQSSFNKSLDLEGGVCGNDDRVHDNDAAVGRIVALNWINDNGILIDTMAYCTGWIASNGAYLTAGHCVDINNPLDGVIDMDVLEFNIQPSNPNGVPRFSDPSDQYAIIHGSVEWENGGVGDDWAVFGVSPNSNTGLLPIEAQGYFYRMSRDHNPDSIRVTGCGVDGPAPCFGEPSQPGCTNPTPPRNSDSQTLQTSVDISRGEHGILSDIHWRFNTDATGGLSGGPLIAENVIPNITIGILTTGIGGTCPGWFAYNAGTSFEANDLENALNDFPDPNTVYADQSHPVAPEDGTVFRPYDTVNEAVTAVPSGGIVSIVTGYYNEPMTISKAMTITAPVGMVTIGASGLGKSAPEAPVIAESAASDTASSLLPAVYSLSHNYPNPFNPVTTIRYGLPEASSVSLVVYDIMGREVIRWDRQEPPGYRQLVWNGTDHSGRLVPSGIYIYRLVAASTASDKRFTNSRKMVLLK